MLIEGRHLYCKQSAPLISTWLMMVFKRISLANKVTISAKLFRRTATSILKAVGDVIQKKGYPTMYKQCYGKKWLSLTVFSYYPILIINYQKSKSK